MKNFFTLERLTMYLIVLVFPMFNACKKENTMNNDDLRCLVVPKDGANDNVIGKWKLVEGVAVFINRKQDYSCDNVIYHFRHEGTLIITGSEQNNIGYLNGEHTFDFTPTKLYEGIEEDFTLKINDISFACRIEANKMILNNSFLDGDILRFVRIE